MSVVHVYPIEDWIEHETEGDQCVCEPRIELVYLAGVEVGKMVIHNRVGPPDEPVPWYRRLAAWLFRRRPIDEVSSTFCHDFWW